MRIAIIGGGISGNLTARLLSTQHDVVLFESNSHVGGHSLTVDVEMSGGPYPVDVGFMVFNDRTYPGFCEMLDRLDVASRPSDMSFSVHCEQTGREYQGSSLNGLFAQRSNLMRPSFLGMIRDVLKFNREAVESLERGELEHGETVGELLTRLKMGESFTRLYLVPMAAAIWSAVPNKIFDFPAKFLIGFFRNHGLLQIKDRPQWRTILGGSRSYVERLLDPIQDRVHANRPVKSVARSEDHVVVRLADESVELFDEVVFACHSDQALSLIESPTDQEREILGALPYQANTAYLHTDASVLPVRQRAWASWNYHVPENFEEAASVTYDLSRLQGQDSPEPILLTLNRTEPVDPGRVIRSFSFEHPIFQSSTLEAQSRHGQISGVHRTHFCGAYWRYGFHEDGVQSALRVASHFGLSLADLDSCSLPINPAARN